MASHKVTYEEYLKALEVVLKFQEQIIKVNEKIKVENINADGTLLLADFLSSLGNKRAFNAIRKYWYYDQIEFDKCTVEYFLYSLYLPKVAKSGKVDIIRTMGKETMIELLGNFEAKGFNIDEIKPFFKY